MDLGLPRTALASAFKALCSGCGGLLQCWSKQTDGVTETRNMLGSTASPARLWPQPDVEEARRQ